jgi:uncharacterized Zn finger protein (UPF0148 family)
MNFVGRIEGAEILVELKYCERCGGLWLRRQGADGVYCAGCRASLEAMPDPGETPPRKARSRRKARTQRTDLQRDDTQRPARIEYLEGVAAMAVWA